MLMPEPAHAGTIISAPRVLGLSRGLVGCWNFDGAYSKVPDCSGNGNTGTITGASKVPGKIGQAMSFGGTNDVVSGTGSELQNMPSLTLSAWIYPRTPGVEDECIFAKSSETDGCSGTAEGWAVYSNTSSRVEFRAYFGNGNLLVECPTVIPDQWQHILITWNGNANASGVRGYRDGAQSTCASVSTTSGTRQDTGSAFSIGNGGDRFADNIPFDGLIDDVRIYNRVLSPAEISRLYRIGLGSTMNRTAVSSPSDKGLVGHWTFDGQDISGTRAKDRSGNNNHGTITGATKKIGKIGQALDFDGVDDLVLTTSDFIGTGSITISAWVYKRSDGGQGSGRIVSNNRTILDIQSSNRVSFKSDGAISANCATGCLMPSRWTHIVVTRNSLGTTNLYSDGIISGPLIKAAVLLRQVRRM